jgi:hypothetical protein
VLPVNLSQNHASYKTAWGVELHMSMIPASLAPIKTDLGASFVRVDLARDWVLANGWAADDNVVKLSGQAGLQLMFILPDVRYTKSPFVIDNPPFNVAAYASFVQSAASRYAGRHIIWEMMNEPNIPNAFNAAAVTAADYVSLAQAVIPVIRKADPSGTIVTGGTSGVAMAWQSAIAGIFPLVDGVGVHPYSTTVGNIAQALQGVASMTGAKPVYVTEFGLQVGQQTTLPAFLSAAKGIVPYFNVYEFQDETPNDQGFGLLTNSGQQRASYAAVRTSFHS